MPVDDRSTSAWISTSSFFPRIPVMLLVLVLVPSQSPEEPQDRLDQYYRMVWKKHPWGKKVGVFIFQGMREDNLKDVHPELLVHNGLVREEYLFITRDEKGEVLQEWAFSCVYWELSLPLGSHYVHVCSQSRNEREMWENIFLFVVRFWPFGAIYFLL